MCNLYNLTTNQQVIRDLAQAMQDSFGNLEPDLDVRLAREGASKASLLWASGGGDQHGTAGKADEQKGCMGLANEMQKEITG